MIVNLRGTNGSGKSTAVRKFLASLPGSKGWRWEDSKATDHPHLVAHHTEGRKQPLYYTCEVGSFKFALLGHYETPCGGTDTLKSYDEIVDLSKKLHKKGYHVLFEGVLISGDTKQMFRIHKAVKDIRVICLTTSLEQSIDNIMKRREKSGRRLGQPLNTKNTKSKHNLVIACRAKMEAAGIQCRSASSDQTARILKKWLSEDV